MSTFDQLDELLRQKTVFEQTDQELDRPEFEVEAFDWDSVKLSAPEPKPIAQPQPKPVVKAEDIQFPFAKTYMGEQQNQPHKNYISSAVTQKTEDPNVSFIEAISRIAPQIPTNVQIPEPRDPEDKRKWHNYVVDAYKRGDAKSSMDLLGVNALFGYSDWDADVKPVMDQYFDLEQQDPIKAKNFLLNSLSGAARMVPAMTKGMGAGAAIALSAGSAIPFPEEIISVPTMSAAGGLLYWSAQGAGDVYNSLRYEGLSHDIAATVSLVQAPLYAAVENAQAFLLLPKPVREEAKRAMGRAMSRVLVQAMIEKGKDFAIEVLEEGAQSIIQDVAKEYARELDPEIKKSFTGKTLVGIAENAVEEMAMAAISMPWLMAPGTAVDSVNFIKEYRKNRKGLANVQDGQKQKGKQLQPQEKESTGLEKELGSIGQKEEGIQTQLGPTEADQELDRMLAGPTEADQELDRMLAGPTEADQELDRMLAGPTEADQELDRIFEKKPEKPISPDEPPVTTGLEKELGSIGQKEEGIQTQLGPTEADQELEADQKLDRIFEKKPEKPIFPDEPPVTPPVAQKEPKTPSKPRKQAESEDIKKLQEISQQSIDQNLAVLAEYEKQKQAKQEDFKSVEVAQAIYSQMKGDFKHTKDWLYKKVTEFLGVDVKKAIKDNKMDAKSIDEAYEYAIFKASADIYSSDESPKSKFDRIKRLYENQVALTTRTSTSIAKQQYSTPIPFSAAMQEAVRITDPDIQVYEPTAGNGLLLFQRVGKKSGFTVVNELDTGSRLEHLRDTGYTGIINEDAENVLQNHPKMLGSFDVVIGNPPFGSVAAGTHMEGFPIKKLEHRIMAVSLRAMKDTGRAVFIIGGTNFSNGKMSETDRLFFNYLYSRYNVVSNIDVNKNLYAKQGTTFPVRVLQIKGRKLEPDKVFAPKQGETEYAETFDELRSLLIKGSNKNVNLQTKPGKQSEGMAEPESKPAAKPGKPISKPKFVVPGSKPTAGESGRGSDTRDSRVREPGRDKNKVSKAKRSRTEEPDPRTVGRDGKSKLTKVGDFQVTYPAVSDGPRGNALIPNNMAVNVSNSLADIKADEGSIDNFVRAKLGYKSKEALYKAFAAEQIDAIALAITNIDLGKALILGDQTGMGKGRVVAAIIRYANKLGKKPIFFTQKPKLFSDLYRDLTDIDHKIKPYILHSKKDEAKIVDNKGKLLFDPNWIKDRRSNKTPKELTKGFDAIFTSYSQINSETRTQRHFLNALAPNNLIVLDESHEASGQSNTGVFVAGLLNASSGAIYSSATWAKRPENTAIYFMTDLKNVSGSTATLVEAMKAGGPPLQNLISANLSELGQYIRREFSYEGIKFETKIDLDNQVKDEKRVDQVTSILTQIVGLDPIKKLAIGTMNLAAGHEATAAGGADATVTSTNFSAVVHNVIAQLLTAIKAESAANFAIQDLKSGKKPVITVMNTMGALFEGEATDSEVEVTFREVLKRSLKNSTKIKIKNEFGEETVKFLSPIEFGAEFSAIYDGILKSISKLDTDIPISFIDLIKYKINQAGYKIDELTGRDFEIEFQGKKAFLRKRKKRSTNDIVNDFNSGKLDSLVINRAGSTGLSLHASEKFSDQKVRSMIVLQPDLNIDVFFQMLGRINRRGQVVLPEYTLFQSSLPAEIRPAVVLQKKMGSLNAQTTANEKSNLTLKNTPDMFNKYGDRVVTDYLSNNELTNDMLGDPLNIRSGEATKENAMQKVTGRISLMPVSLQKEFYTDIEQEYDALMTFLNDTGRNDLVSQTYDFQAETLNKELLKAGENENNPFQSSTYIETIKAKELKKPYLKSKIESIIEKNVEHGDPDKFSRDIITKMDNAQSAYQKNIKTKYSTEVADQISQKMDDMYDSLAQLANKFRVGNTYNIRLDEQEPDSESVVLLNIKYNPGKGNPLSFSKLQFVFATQNSSQTISLTPISKKTLDSASFYQRGVPYNWDSQIPKENYSTRMIITGNILEGFIQNNNRGQVINFTTKSGPVRQGLLLGKKNKASDFDFLIMDPTKLSKYFGTHFKDDGQFDFKSTDNNIRIVFRPRIKNMTLNVPKSRKRGGVFFLDDRLLALADREFRSGQHTMTTIFSGENIGPAMDRLSELGVSFKVTDEKIRAGKVDLVALGREQSNTVENFYHPARGAVRIPEEFDKINIPEQNPLESVDPEIEKRYQASKSDFKSAFFDRMKENVYEFLVSFRRSFINLDPQKYAKAQDMFRRFNAIPGTSKFIALDYLRDVTENFGPKKYDLFSRNVILPDLLKDLESGLYTETVDEEEMIKPLPWGYNEEKLRLDILRFEELARQNPDVQNALKKREKYMRTLREDLVRIGSLNNGVLNDDRYFHHQVLEHLTDKPTGFLGSKDVRIHKKGWQLFRVGSAKDYSVKYLDSEYEVVAQGLEQILTYEILQEIDEEYNSMDDYKAKAKDANWENFNARNDELAKSFGFEINPDTGEYPNVLNRYFNQPIAIQFNRLSQQADSDLLSADTYRLYPVTIKELLADKFTDMDNLQILSQNRAKGDQLFPLLNYLVSNKLPGSTAAASIMRLAVERKQFIKETLATDYKTYKDYMGPDEVEWQPSLGRVTYKAATISEKLFDELTEKGALEITPDMVRTMLVLGGQKPAWILPKPVALTMDEVNVPVIRGPMSKLSHWVQNTWKQIKLFMPDRLAKYNINNMSGDMDIAMAYDPKILTYMKKANRDLLDLYYHQQRPPADMLSAIQLGVMDSGFTEEVPSLSENAMFRVVTGVTPNWLQGISTGYWDQALKFTQYRENVLRLSAYRYFLDEHKKGKNPYAASRRYEMDAIERTDHRSAKLARELIGDYGAISSAGQWIRSHLMPFYSFQEINTPRYVRLFLNAPHEGKQFSGSKVLNVLFKRTLRSSMFFMLYGMIKLINKIFFPEEDREIEKSRRQTHLILGRNPDTNKVISLRFQGAFSDVLEYFNLADFTQDYVDLMYRDMPIKTKLTQGGKTFVSKWVNSLSPAYKGLGELISGQKFYPSAFEPRPLRDRVEYLFQQLQLDMPYRRIAGKPTRPLKEDLLGFVLYQTDTGESAYWETKNAVYSVLREQGIEPPTISPSPKSNALYLYKKSLLYKDDKATKKYWKKYESLGGTKKSAEKSIEMSHPMGRLKVPTNPRSRILEDRTKAKMRKTVIERVTRKTYDDALKWYRKVYTKR